MLYAVRSSGRHVGRRLLAGVAIGAFCLPVAAYGQTHEPSQEGQLTKPKADSAPADGNAPASEIVVSGIRSSLEDALEIRRKADVILDGISADDIGSTPDLNLGEALARIPGVQINREEGRRDATISVRGLPGNFTLSTVQGQRIASTSRGISFNAGNPFGIFDSSIFNGANVVKSFTGDTPSGGLAAVVDLRINSALDRKEGLVVRAEGTYEESTRNTVPGFFVSGAKKFGDRFGVYGTVAYTDLDFRREAVSINNYSAFNDAQLAGFAAGTIATGVGITDAEAETLNGASTGGLIGLRGPNPEFAIDAVGANGLNNRVIFGSNPRQFIQRDTGYRVSGAAGFAFELNDQMTFRLDGIFTRRDLKNSTQDNVNTGLVNGGINANQTLVTPLSNPVSVGTFDFDEDGIEENVFVVPRVFASDALISYANRFFPAFEESFALYPQFNFENEDWRFNAIGTYSEATGIERLFNFDVRPRQRGGATRDTNNNGIDDAGTQNFAYLNNGLGDLNQFFFNTSADPRLLTFDRGTQNVTIPGGSSGDARFNVRITPEIGGAFNSPVSLLVQGFNSQVDRDLKTADFELARKFSNSIISEIEVGGFISQENSVRSRRDLGALGANLSAFGGPDFAEQFFGTSQVLASGAPFLNGEVPGAERDGFLSLNIDLLRDTLLPIARELNGVTFNPNAANLRGAFPELDPDSAATLTVDEILAAASIVPGTGFLQRVDQGIRNQNRFNFTSERRTIETYGQVKFNLENVSDTRLRGNFGLRYVNTKLDGVTNPPALEFINAVNAIRATNGTAPLVLRDGATLDQGGSAQFSRLLPSVNLIYDITPNLTVRAAYYHTFEAFDLAEFVPTPTLVVDLEPGDDPEDTTVGIVVGSDGQVIPSTVVSVSSLDILPRSSKAFDIGISWYNKKGSVVSLGYFEKTLENDIANFNNFCPAGETVSFGGRTFADLGNDSGRCSFINENGDRQRVRIGLSVNNPENATISGFEGQVQQTLEFLPGPLGNLGVIANFTKINSKGDESVALIRVADLTYNLIGYYEDQLFQARLAFNHQSEIELPNGGSFGGGARRVAPRGQLDFSGAIRPTKEWEVRFEVFNITQSARREFLETEQLFRNYQFDGRTFALSTTYRF
jgi:TonB-dependent receptor